MYFLSDEERSFLTGRLLPEARKHGVHPELRGWNWQEPPLSPVYDARLTVEEISGKYCTSGRDLYLRRVLGIDAAPNRVMRESAVLHRVLTDLLVDAKRIIYQAGPNGCVEQLAQLGVCDPAVPPEFGLALRPALVTPSDGHNGTGAGGTRIASGLQTREQVALWNKVVALSAFERQRIVTRVQDVLAREPQIGADALVTLALPVTVERQLNGLFLGLAPHLTVDAAGMFEGMLFDVRFEERQDFHRLTTAASALVTESLYGYPVDIGCIVYVTFAADRVLVERDLHGIDDELRQWFLEERDERTRLVSEEIDPGLPEACYATCPYWQHCHAR